MYVLLSGIFLVADATAADATFQLNNDYDDPFYKMYLHT